MHSGSRVWRLVNFFPREGEREWPRYHRIPPAASAVKVMIHETTRTLP